MNYLHCAKCWQITLVNLEHMKPEALSKNELIAQRQRAVVLAVQVEAVEAVPVGETQTDQHRLQPLGLLQIQLLEGCFQGWVEAREGRQADVIWPSRMRLILAQKVRIIINNLLAQVGKLEQHESLVQEATWVDSTLLGVVKVNPSFQGIDSLLLNILTQNFVKDLAIGS